MSRQETLETYWDEFLAWGDLERQLADGFLEFYVTSVETKPTEENFWLWYSEHKFKKER